MNVKKMLDEIKKNVIDIDFDIDYKGEFEIGATRLGGKPDLPKDFDWFYYVGGHEYAETKNRPLSFLAQINCAQIKEYDKDDVLPESGILYFFYELATMKWGFDPKDKGCARVYYYDGDIRELQRTDFPDDMEDEYKIPAINMDLSSSFNVPDYEEFSDHYGYNDWDSYNEIKASMGYKDDEDEDWEETSKLLGYANIIQHEMLLKCERVTNGIYCGSPSKIKPINLKQMKKDCKEWHLLFQLSTVEVEDYELMFGDCGSIFFYIKKDDLENKNFDNCWLILQCG